VQPLRINGGAAELGIDMRPIAAREHRRSAASA
jgi:hypothetical protein